MQSYLLKKIPNDYSCVLYYQYFRLNPCYVCSLLPNSQKVPLLQQSISQRVTTLLWIIIISSVLLLLLLNFGYTIQEHNTHVR